jgi:hypothetical protein
MSKQHDGRPLSDVAPGVAEDLPEEGQIAEEPSPDRKVAKNYEEAMERGAHARGEGRTPA